MNDNEKTLTIGAINTNQNYTPNNTTKTNMYTA